MLDRLRRHAAGFGTKVILGMMTAGLLFYFGYAGVRKAERGGTVGGGHHAIAQVNGEGIPEGQFQTLYDNQLKFYEQLTKGSTPPALLESVKQNVLQKLIQNKIFSQQAKALGLSVSDKELIHDITSDPKLSENGVFNKKYYLDVFKPSFERQTGEDYETLLREELLAEKFENLIRNSVSVTEAEVKQEYLLSNTQLNLEKISLDPAQFKEDAVKKKEAETEILAALKEKLPRKDRAP
ncbi:MAG: SurA N-terminal domain-containing protein [bacterium]